MNKRIYFSMLFYAALSISLQAEVVETFTTPGTGTWVCPSDIQQVTIECWGAGGAGGSAQTIANTYLCRAGGGAGGSYAKTTIINPTPGSYSYTVGAGGIAAEQGTFADLSVMSCQNGGSTTFNNTTVVAVGGPGGQNGYEATGTGTGGVAPQTGNTGDVVYYGGNGASATTNVSYPGSGGGGGSAGAAGNGENGGTSGLGPAAGAAGAGGGAIGGTGTNINATLGTDGASPGAGGAGSVAKTTLNKYCKGGVGGNGKLVITTTSIATALTENSKTKMFFNVNGHTILLDNEVMAIDIFNTSGKQIESQKKVSSITLKNSGIYIIKILTSEGVNYQKLCLK